jgi:hypothetical protein
MALPEYSVDRRKREFQEFSRKNRNRSPAAGSGHVRCEFLKNISLKLGRILSHKTKRGCAPKSFSSRLQVLND